MKVFQFIVLIAFITGCGNPSTDAPSKSNNPADPPPATAPAPVQNQDGKAVLADFSNLATQFEDIRKRVVEEQKNWATSYEEMQYPKATIESLSEENQKKLEVLYKGAKDQGDRYQALVNEVSNWSLKWEDLLTRSNRVKEEMESGETTGNYQQDLATLNQKMQEAREKIQDWSIRLSKLKSETVVIYNTVNGIVVSSGLN